MVGTLRFAHPTVLAKDGLLRRFAPRHDGDGAASHRAVIPRACGVSSTLRPLDSITDVSEYWVARRSLSSGGHSADPLAGDDDWECGAFVAIKRTFATSPRYAPEPLMDLPPKEGVGNAGCPLHPRPRVHLVVVERTRVTTSTPESPDVPARNGFNGFLRALPGD